MSRTSYLTPRGIDVLVEIDTPGHTSAISKAYPEYIACTEATPWATYANEPPAGQLRLASPATVNFTADLLSAAAKLFPSTLFSTGGDEINEQCYQDDAETQQELAGRTIVQALDTFTQATHGALRSLGKTPVVWEEMVLGYNLTLSNDTIAMVWISSENAAAVATKGYRFIHAASNSFYLDCGAGEWLGNDPRGNSWCDPFKNWQNVGHTPPSPSPFPFPILIFHNAHPTGLHLRPAREPDCRTSATRARWAATALDGAVWSTEPRLDRVAPRRSIC
jgi:hexosaminidase